MHVCKKGRKIKRENVRDWERYRDKWKQTVKVG